ncbi:MAG: hypothetical protein RLZ12_402, partial [Bacillota bacterium]|jgi:tRNA(adenine34) deaminase
MRLALACAKQAQEVDEVPVGAVLVHETQILATGFNLRETSNDPTAHAEIIALRRAADKLGSWRMPQETALYVTLEPCPMCAGAILQARVATVIFGCSDPKAGCCGTLYNIVADTRFNHQTIVTGGVLAAECSEILQTFFKQKR